MIDPILASSGGDGDIAIVAIVFGTIYLIVRTIFGAGSKRRQQQQLQQALQMQGGGFSPEQAALLEKIHRSLAQTEARVEALETILIDRTAAAQQRGKAMSADSPFSPSPPSSSQPPSSLSNF